MQASWRVRVAGFAGLAIALLLLAWALRDVRLADALEHLRRAHLGWFAAALGVALLTLPLRVLRWGYLLRVEGSTISFASLWHATAIGLLANNVLPARAGDVARGYAARELGQCRFSTALGSILVERLLDGLTVALLLAVAIVAGGFDTRVRVGGVSIHTMATAGAVTFGALVLALAFVVRWPELVVARVRPLVHRLAPERIVHRLESIGQGVVDGFRALRTIRRVSILVLWSVVLWLANAASIWIGCLAFGLAVPWTAALTVQGIMTVGIMLPPAPGFFGVFEAATRASLVLYGISGSAAASFGLTYHLALFATSSLVGLWSFWKLKPTRLRLAHPDRDLGL